MAGRRFQTSDTVDSELVAVINESAAELLFPGGDAVGRTIAVSSEFRVVGVVADIKHLALEKGSGFQLYLPMSQTDDYETLDLVVRSGVPLESIRSSVAAAIGRVDSSMATNDVRTLDSVVERAVSPRRFTLSLLTGFASVALLLAALGIYGVLSYTVAERQKEIAIRMALGESVHGIRWRVLGRTLALSGVGSIVGVGTSLVVARLIASMLFGIEGSDLSTVLLAPSILFAVAALAGWLPAIRASRVDALATLQRT